jgi:hypothetical protein
LPGASWVRQGVVQPNFSSTMSRPPSVVLPVMVTQPAWLFFDEEVGAHHVGGDLDPAEVVLLGERDVDVDQLVRARADLPLFGLPPLRLEDQAHRLRFERSVPGGLAERARPLVVEVDRRSLRLRVDDHQPFGVDVGQHRKDRRGRWWRGRRRSRRGGRPGCGGRRARRGRRLPRNRRRTGRGGRSRRRGRRARHGRRGNRRRWGREQLSDHVQAKPDLRGVAGVRIVLQIALEVLLRLLELLGLLVGDGDVEQERRVGLLVVGL